MHPPVETRRNSHIEQELLVSSQIAHPQKGVTMLKAANAVFSFSFGLEDFVFDYGPIDYRHAVCLSGVRRCKTLQSVPVRQRMPCHGTGNAVIGSFPDTAPGVRIRLARSLPGGRFHRKVSCGGQCYVLRSEVGKQKGVFGHKFIQDILWIVMPAGRIYPEGHWDMLGPFETDGSQRVFSNGVGEVHSFSRYQ